MSNEFSLVLDAKCELAESPVWWAAAGKLVFVDITGRRLHRFDPRTGQHEVDVVEEDIGCVAPAKGGGYVAGLRSGLWLLDAAGGKVRQLAPNPENSTNHRFNDGRVDPRGRYLSGTLDESKTNGDGGLYRFDRSGVAKLMSEVMTGNGLAFSADGKVLYFSDTPRFVIYRFDYDPETGAATNRQVFARIEPTATDRGRPDGAAVDADGCYWSSLYEGSRIRRYDPDGKMMSDHHVPALNTTMPAFGGADMKTLFVTTAHDKKGGPGGGVYAMPVDVPGVPGTLFDPEC